MLNNQTLDKLKNLRLTGMAQAFSEQLTQPPIDLDFNTRLAMLVEREYLLRDNRKLKRRLQDAKLQQQAACIENIKYDPTRGLEKAKIQELSYGQWIRNHLPLIITGATGTGKTYIACALAHQACMLGFTSKYYRLTRLWDEIKIVKADGTYIKWLAKQAKLDVLVLDDWGLAALTDANKQDLLEILDDRFQLTSTIVTSQLSIEHWHEYLNDDTFADAILDRLVHKAIRIDLKGESMRKVK